MSQAGKSGNNGGNQAGNQAKPVEQQASLAESLANQVAITPTVPRVESDPETMELRRRLEIAEKALKDEQARNAELMELEAGRKISINDKPYVGDAGYTFEVGPRDRAKFPELPIEKFKATDEAEAKRWYLNSHDYPKGSGIVIDPIAIVVDVKCIDPRRNEVILLAKRLGVIRSKLDRGQQLTDEETGLMIKYEARVHNY